MLNKQTLTPRPGWLAWCLKAHCAVWCQRGVFTWSPRPAPHIVSSPAGVPTKHCAGLQLETGKMATKESIMNLRRQSVMAPHLAPLYVVSVGYPRCVRPPDQTVVASPLHLPCHLANRDGRPKSDLNIESY